MKIKVWVTILILLSASCGAGDANTPTAAFRRYIEAVDKKDSAAMKELSTGGSQKLVDETLKNRIGKINQPETRNERVENSNATLEYKNAATGTWDKVYFVREDNRWKLALDKSMQEILKNDQRK